MKAFLLPVAGFVALVAVVYGAMTTFAYPIKYKHEISTASHEFGVCPALVASVIRAESKFAPDAVSTAGAVGLMQIMPSTAEYIARKMPMDDYDLFHPGDNIRMGTFYLRYLLNQFDGNVRLSLMAYNAGPGNVRRWLADDPELNKTPFPETNAYIERVFNAKSFYRYRF